ncbi:synaptogenesis protein syg-2-like [Ruditapes philippinarum]|uniref:synaptogenesis protein syg-2-like n=1 Tax=Ruditapes philippinarum TaxID=129788 RepID=UPI00295B81DC|nr:synaptogenesis protein syg-2-like [Ruditapes philippinarum]
MMLEKKKKSRIKINEARATFTGRSPTHPSYHSRKTVCVPGEYEAISLVQFVGRKDLYVVNSSVILSPLSALAVDQESFTWTCTYNGSETVLGFLWSLNGNTLAVILSPACTPFGNPGPPDSSLYEYACLSANQATFTVKQISDMNNGNDWRCAVAAPGYIYSDNVTVLVQVSVNNVSLTPPTGSIRENVETIFTCQTSSSRPAANITWYRESTTGQNQVITSKVSSTTESAVNLEKSTSVLKYTPSRSDNRYKIYCQALNIPGRTPMMSTKFQMDVQYSPESAPYIQYFSNGRTYKVIENSRGELSCIIKGGNPLATLAWNCFNNGLSTDTSGTTVTKTVTWFATRGPDRSCTCQSSHPITGTQSVSVIVQVLYTPDSPRIKVKGTAVSGPINFIDGKSSSVLCKSNGKPNPDSYSWNKAGSSSRAGDTLTFNPVQKQDDGQYICSAQNTMVPSSGDTQTGSNSSTVKINVLYAPEITTLDNQDIVAGSSVNVQCPIIKGNPNPTTFKWTRNGDNRTWSTQTLYIQNVSKNDDMMYTCTVQNIMRPTGSAHETGTDSGSFHLSVLYMASVTSFIVKGNQSSQLSVTVDEKADVQFICTVDSNPGSSIKIQLPDKTFYRKESTKTLIYNHTKATCLDTGVYTCSASNAYNLGKVSEKKLTLFVRCYPRPLTPVKGNVNSALRIQSSFSFKGLAYPIPIFTWYRKQGTVWKELSNNTHTSISITGVDTNLTINNVSTSDYGEYQLKIENEIDIFIQHYTLIPEDIPENPQGFQHLYENLTESSITVHWIPGFDGGPRQTFVLRYKTNSDMFWTDINISDNGEKNMSYTVTSLTSGTLYNFVLYARNKIGNSSQTAVLGIRTERSSDCDTDSCHNEKTTTIIVGCVLGIVIILLACYAGYITLLLKRTKGEQHKIEMHVTSSAGKGVPAYANLSYSATENNEHECTEMSNAVISSSNIDTNEYMSLDDKLRENKETYDVINAKR